MYRAGWSLPGSRALGLLCLILHCSPFASATSIPVSDTGIIRVGGTATLGLNGGGLGFQASFVDKKCRPFAFSGWNSWEVVEAAFGVASALPLNMRTPDAGKDLLDWIFDQGQGAGMNVMRFLGHGWSSKMSLQSKPGVYNEDVLVALDWVVHNAYQRGLKIVMTFADNNNEVDSRIWYAKEAGKQPMEFFTDPMIKCWFKNNLKYIVNRRNTFSGFLYKEDPTILGWNLLNEPRCDCDITVGGPYCELSCAHSVSAWIWEMADFLKTVDSNHMVVVGEEGFYTQTIEKHWVNPDAFIDNGAPWASHVGHDFVWDHSSPAIDYLGVHINTDKWCMPKKWYQALFIREHQTDAWHLNKPLVIEEFGKIVFNYVEKATCSERDQYFEQVYDTFNADIKAKGPLQGLCFSELDAAGGHRSNLPPEDGNADGFSPRLDSGLTKTPRPYGVRPDHAVWKNVIDPISWSITSEIRLRPLQTYCMPGEFRSMDAIFYSEFMSGGGGAVVDDDVFYATHGTRLDAQYLGMELGEIEGCVTYLTCMQKCENLKGCIAFRFNPAMAGGVCKFYTKASDSHLWNSDGWQVFYKKKAFRNCLDDGCKLCNEAGICVRCDSGSLYWDVTKDRPVCRASVHKKSPEEPEKKSTQFLKLPFLQKNFQTT